MLEAGTYTIICSTFEAGQTGSFTLRADSNQDIALRKLPREGAGLLETVLSNAVFRAEQQKIAAPIKPNRLSKLIALVKHLPNSQSPSSANQIQCSQQRSLIRVSLEIGRGPTRKFIIISSNGEFSDSGGGAGVRTDEVDVSPSQTVEGVNMWLVIERMSTPTNLGEEVFGVELWHDAPDACAVGVWRKWDD